MPKVTTHPTPQELSDFGLGRLPDAAASVIASHLNGCVDCRKTVENLPPDSFLGKFRTTEAETASLMTGGTALPATASHLGESSSFADVPIDIPPELAKHPKFRILRVLGRGGMGVVYEAEHAMMGRHVALKVISPAVLNNPEALARFLGEAKAAGQLDHQNIARAYDADQAGGLHFLVMEFVEGMSLAQVLERKGPRPIAHACHYARQAAMGLDHAFATAEMVHRDIKPQNLMLTPKGLVKVLDFGLARLQSERKRGEGLTQADAFMGTPEYVSPEQATDARKADIRADIYSLGCTLYALLTGHPPFQEDTVMKIVLAQIEKTPRPLHEIRKDVPLELSAVVARMLAKDPARRYRRPIEVAQALEPFVRAGAKSGKSVPSDAGTSSAKTGTVSPGDTSQMNGLGQALPKGPSHAVPPPVVEGLSPRWDNFVNKDGAPSATKPKNSRRPASARLNSRKEWWIWSGASVGALLFGLLVLWAAGAFRVKTANGILVIENVPADAEVTVDGETVTLSRNGQQVTVQAVKEGKHQIKAVLNGIEILSSDVTVKFGGDPVRIRVEPPNGVLIIENVPADAEVTVDGKKAILSRNGQQVTVSAIDAGERKINVVSHGVQIYSSAVDIKLGGKPIRVQIQKPLEEKRSESPPLLGGKSTPKEDRFVPLFNGKDLAGWTKTGDQHANWRVDSGVLIGTAAPAPSVSVLLSKKNTFKNFHIRVKTMMGSGKNTHLSFRAGSRVMIGGTDPDEAPKMAVLEDQGQHLDPSGKPYEVVRPGEWFTLEVIATSKKITVIIDGKKMLEHEAAPSGVGPIGMMCRGGGTVYFKEIEIKELADPELMADAPETASRQLWVQDHGYFIQGLANDWFEKYEDWTKSPNLFYETRRTDEFVELRHSSLPAFYRLYKDKALFKNERFSSEFKQAYEGKWRMAPVSVDQSRQIWIQVHGYFIHGLGQDWYEKFEDGKKTPNRFNEVRRTDEFVELRHYGVPVTYRLYKDKAQIKDERHSKEFKPSYEGKWQTASKASDPVSSIPPKTTIAAADRDPPVNEFVSLFNGKDLTGWRLAGSKTTNLPIVDGSLTAQNSGPGGYVDHLLTARTDYTDCRLRCEFQPEDAKRPARVQFRVDPSNVTFGGMRGYLVEVQGSTAPGAMDGGSTSLGLASRVRGTYQLAQANHPALAARQWHKLEIVVTGKRIQVRLNAQPILDYVDEGQTFLRGPIALQFRPGDSLRYRAIEVFEDKHAAIPEPDSSSDRRTRWTSQALVGNQFNERWQVFQKAGGMEWIESVNDHPRFLRFAYTEVARTKDYIELERSEGSGKVVVRLYDTYGDGGPSVSELKRRDGKWEK